MRRQVDELAVARPMVAMAVRVADDQAGQGTVPRPALAMIPSTVGRSGKEIRVGRRPCVMQQHRVRAEQQVQERRLEVDAFALAEDQRVLVAGDNLDGRIGRLVAIGGAVDPLDGGEVGRGHPERISASRQALSG